MLGQGKLSRLRKFSTTAMRLWNESEILVDRKSKFQGRSCAIKSQKEIDELLQDLLQSDKRIAKASHPHMYAWRTGSEIPQQSETKGSKLTSKKGKKINSEKKIANIEQGCSDNGESGAGQRLLTLLEQADLVNVLVVVTRWYGGTPLGSSRFRHISTTAVESLKKGQFLL